MENKIKVEYLFKVKLAYLESSEARNVVLKIKKRLGLTNQQFSRRLTGKIKDVNGHELKVWSEELKCTIDELYKKPLQINSMQVQ